MSIGFTNAQQAEIEKNSENQNNIDIHIGVFFDGTGNNMVREVYDKYKIKQEKENKSRTPYSDSNEDEWLREINLHPNVSDEELSRHEGNEEAEHAFSNVAVLYSLFNPDIIKQQNQSSNSIINSFYIEGAGTSDMSKYFKTNAIGAGFGTGDTGVVALVSKAVRSVSDFLLSLQNQISSDTKVHFYIFGFSRGATCARLFSHLITRSPNGERLPREKDFSNFLSKKYFEEGLCSIPWKRMKTLLLKNVTVDFLGIYDTVSSIGILQRPDGSYALAHTSDTPVHFKNCSEYGLYVCPNKEKLKHVCHLCALDEFRENFALTSVGGQSVPSNCVELLIPGCHSDVGGGYITGEEQEIILRKQTGNYNIVEQCKRIAIGEQCKSFVKSTEILVSPEKRSRSKLTLTSMKMIGWLQDNFENLQFDENEENSARTIAAIETEHDIKFKRYVFRGYSDISLAMMKEQCTRMNCSLFDEPPIAFNYRMRQPDLVAIGDKLLSKLKNTSEGKRTYYYPGNAYDSQSYRLLRQKYLHFSCTDNIVHKPYMEGGTIINRLIYWGEKKDVASMSCESDIHYLPDLY